MQIGLKMNNQPSLPKIFYPITHLISSLFNFKPYFVQFKCFTQKHTFKGVITNHRRE